MEEHLNSDIHTHTHTVFIQQDFHRKIWRLGREKSSQVHNRRRHLF